MAPGMQPPPAVEEDMSLIDLLAEMAISEFPVCEKCGQKVDKKYEDGVKQLNEMIDFEKGGMYPRYRELKDFNEFFKDTRRNQSLLQIFTPEENAYNGEIENHDMVFEKDLLSTSVPNHQSIPMAPLLLKRPIVDLLTGLELGLTLPKTEALKPSKYVPKPAVGILIDFDEEEVIIRDENEPIPRKEVEEILRFLYPDLDVPTLRPTSPTIPSPTKEPEKPVEDETPTDSPVEIELSNKQKKKKNKKNRKKTKAQNENIDPALEAAEAAVKAAEFFVKSIEPTIKIPEPTIKAIEPIVEVSIPPAECLVEPQYTASMMPRRKNLSKAGECGTKIQIFVNMLAINFGDKFTQQQIEQYSVYCDPYEPKSLRHKAYAAVKAQYFSELNPVYFNGVILSVGCLPIESQMTAMVNVIDDNGKKIEVKVTIEKKFKGLDLNWFRDVQNEWKKEHKYLTGVTALQLIMNSAAIRQSIRANRSYFTPPDNGFTDLGGGMEMWCGLFQSVTVGWKPFLKVDVKHKGFVWDKSVVNYIKSIFDIPLAHLNFNFLKSNWTYVNDRLTNLRVTITFDGAQRSHQLVLGLLDTLPHETFYPGVDGKISSVRDYFLQKGYVIQYPDLPCLKISSGGTEFFIPMELCTVDGEESMDGVKMNDSQRDKLYEAAVTDAEERQRKIFRVLNTVHKENDDCLKNFDVSISREFEKVDARILDPPTLYFDPSGDVGIEPEDGVWDVPRLQYPTTRLTKNQSWTILNMSSAKTSSINIFAKMFECVGMKLGMEIGEPLKPFPNLSSDMSSQFIAKFLQDMKILDVQVVIVVIPNRSKQLYCTIKQVAELQVGIVTQCVKSTTLECNNDEDMAKNLLMNVNAKLGGVNYSFVCGIHRPDCLWEATIIMGADVTHSNDKSVPSISALVASQDPNSHFQYNAVLRFQPPGVEIMYDLEDMVREQLRSYYHKTNEIKPTKIIYYRDGVGESEFARVMNTELRSIQRACESIEPSYKPRIIFVVVQKRINTRFFPLSHDEAGDDYFNVKVGTIVDTVVTHPTDIDFILLSYPTEQGTATPAKYRCLWNDGDAITQDELEQLTYYLCYMFARSPKSVKYPAPTYYAHHAAARARVLTQGMSINLDDLPNEQTKLRVHHDLVNNSPMYFL